LLFELGKRKRGKEMPISADSEAVFSAGGLAGDKSFSSCTRQWFEAHAATVDAPVRCCRFDAPVPLPKGTKIKNISVAGKDVGARRSGEIEYASGSLKRTNVSWQPSDCDPMTSLAAETGLWIGELTWI
jgi:hypothetical protein